MVAAPTPELTGTDLPAWIQRSVVGCWRRGSDTLDLAQHFDMAEADVCRIIAAEQDRRHEERCAARTAILRGLGRK